MVCTVIYIASKFSENISIFHVCMGWIENLSRGSLIGITRLAEWCRTVILSDRFFYRHHTPMIDTFSCIPFDYPTFDFQSRTCYEITLLPLKGFYLSLKKSTLPATAVRFFMLTSNLHKVTSFSDVTAVKNQRHLTT